MSTYFAVKVTIHKHQSDFIQIADLQLQVLEKSIDHMHYMSLLRYSFAVVSLCVLYLYWKQVT